MNSSVAAVGGGALVAAVLISAAVLYPKQQPKIGPERPALTASAAPSATIPAVDSERQRLMDVATKLKVATTLGDALAVTKPHMVDSFGASSMGTRMLAAWSAQALDWPDVAVAKDETSFAMAKKDIDAERGKRLCLFGHVIEIVKDGVEGLRYFSGLMESSRADLFHFYAVKNTGRIVEGSRARFCGVVTGEFSYKNSSGGTGHAVDLVGMFDLPENKQ